MRVLTTNLFQLFLDATLHYPEKIALIIKDEFYSYALLKNRTDALSAYLVKSGLCTNGRVLIQSGNTLDTVLSFWATLQAGAIPVIISQDLSPKKTLDIIDDAASSHYIGTYASEQLPRNNLKHFKAYQKSDDSCDKWKQRLDVDLASIIYTSGSTGQPKGVMLSQHNMLAATHSLLTYLGYQPQDKIISVLPLSFDYGLYQMILAFSVGATLILEQNLFLPHYFLKRVERFRATILPVVPSMITLFSDALKRADIVLDSVRLTSNTGTALRENHIKMLKSMFPEATLYSMYGLTECKRVSYLPPETLDKKPGSVGVAIPNTEIMIVDDNGNELPPYQIGQLVVRGSTVMQGYWNKSLETAHKLKPGHLPFEQVLYTGDYCYLDDEGYLFFCGRMDEMLKNRGIKVSPNEIEDIISILDGVKEVVVVGVDNILYGSEICACISLVENANLTREKIRAFCQKRLENEKIPTQFHLLAVLPKTPNGKIDKLALQMLITDNRMAS